MIEQDISIISKMNYFRFQIIYQIYLFFIALSEFHTNAIRTFGFVLSRDSKTICVYEYSRIKFVRNSSMSLNSTLSKNEKVEHHIRIKTHKFIILRFWIKSGVNPCVVELILIIKIIITIYIVYEILFIF